MGLVNTHIHTPFSFSAFDSVEQAARLAAEEQIEALGISDFNTTEGFPEFTARCAQFGIYPLYNIEYIAISWNDRQRNLRWNDPKNPGIMYFCGKALNHPLTLSSDSRNLLNSLWKGTQDHIWKIISAVNEHLRGAGLEIVLDYNRIRTEYAKNTVRERHVAKALYLAFVEKWSSPIELTEAFRKLFGDPSFSADLADSAEMQNVIRNRLLKAGAPAYIEEKPEAFLSFQIVRSLILESGGIPCYPVLADDKSGLTEHEKDPQELADTLTGMGIHAVEFIPVRNTFDSLKNYVQTFHSRGFCVTFGTEHNTPERVSLLPMARGGRVFDEELMKIGFEGACILAAHQEQRRTGRPGFVDELGQRVVGPQQVRDFIRTGKDAIKKAAHQKVAQDA